MNAAERKIFRSIYKKEWAAARKNLVKKQKGICPICKKLLTKRDGTLIKKVQLHHIDGETSKDYDYTLDFKNCIMVHCGCHSLIHKMTSEKALSLVDYYKRVQGTQRRIK